MSQTHIWSNGYVYFEKSYYLLQIFLLLIFLVRFSSDLCKVDMVAISFQYF